MAVQSDDDHGTVRKDESSSPGSDRETESAQEHPRGSTHLDDPDIDQAAVKSVPGEGGPDDAGDIEVDDEAIRESIAQRARDVGDARD